MAVTWTSRYLANMLADTASAPIPTEDGAAYTLATGWVWALASPQPEKQALGAQLAEFLTESDFLAQWTLAAGYLPPRPSSLQAWPDTSLQSLMSKVILSAQIYPSGDVLTSLGPLLEQATVQVLKEQADPATAAQDAVSGLPVP
jgi:multiple sugar transport system substrate-binding protein